MDTQTSLTLFNAIATAGKTLYDIAQSTSKLETKQQLMGVYDALMNLKRQAADLEDENHELKAKLRFKGDEFEFKNPFWYGKGIPTDPLCAKCFYKEIIAPMGELYAATGVWRACLVCENRVEIERGQRHDTSYGPPGEWS